MWFFLQRSGDSLHGTPGNISQSRPCNIENLKPEKWMNGSNHYAAFNRLGPITNKGPSTYCARHSLQGRHQCHLIIISWRQGDMEPSRTLPHYWCSARHRKKLKLKKQAIDPDLVGAHSLHAGGAMALKLHGYSYTTIMKMGRWTSLNFLQYTHNQIAHLSKDISKKMSMPLPFVNVAAI